MLWIYFNWSIYMMVILLHIIHMCPKRGQNAHYQHRVTVCHLAHHDWKKFENLRNVKCEQCYIVNEWVMLTVTVRKDSLKTFNEGLWKNWLLLPGSCCIVKTEAGISELWVEFHYMINKLAVRTWVQPPKVLACAIIVLLNITAHSLLQCVP